MALKFYICETCGNLVEKIDDSGVKIKCCGSDMTELIAGTTDAAKEKHIPVITCGGGKVTVKVGEIAHPMTKEHWIKWIVLETERGVYRKTLSPDEKPETEFFIADGEKIKTAYAYCNLHSLWKADV